MLFFIESTIGCMITLMGFWFISDKLFDKNKIKNVKNLFLLLIIAIILTILNILSNGNLDKIIKIISGFILLIFFNKYQYKRKMADTILITFIAYINLYLAEVSLALLLSIIFEIIGTNMFGLLKYSLIMNVLSMTTSLLIFKILNKIYIKIINKVKKHDLNIIISVLLVLIIITILLTKTPVETWHFGIDFITTMSLIIMFCFIGIYMIKQKSEIDKITDKYIKLAEYAKNNEGLLEEYRINLHENKNRLITIDNMVPAKYKEVHEYIGELIKKNKSNKYYWLTELKYVPLSELKGFMNYKIMEMINDKLEVEVNISRELDKKIIKNYNVKDKEELYSIVGVFLDNAYEASKLSKEKAVSIQMFMEKKDLKLIIANTYKGKINLEKIDEYGYSSKGINRGTGLHIVSEIVSRNPLFEKETSILDNYFVQTLTLHSKKIKRRNHNLI